LKERKEKRNLDLSKRKEKEKRTLENRLHSSCMKEKKDYVKQSTKSERMMNLINGLPTEMNNLLIDASPSHYATSYDLKIDLPKSLSANNAETQNAKAGSFAVSVYPRKTRRSFKSERSTVKLSLGDSKP
jgi:hypothetical protein